MLLNQRHGIVDDWHVPRLELQNQQAAAQMHDYIGTFSGRCHVESLDRTTIERPDPSRSA